MSDNKNYITFIDSAGRSIFGAVTEETEQSLKVENPVMIIVQQQENGQMSVQLFPLFFPEFVEAPEGEDRHSYFTYSKSNIAVASGFVEQYTKIVNPSLVPVKEPGGQVQNAEPEVIKLFDE